MCKKISRSQRRLLRIFDRTANLRTNEALWSGAILVPFRSNCVSEAGLVLAHFMKQCLKYAKSLHMKRTRSGYDSRRATAALPDRLRLRYPCTAEGRKNPAPLIGADFVRFVRLAEFYRSNHRKVAQRNHRNAGFADHIEVVPNEQPPEVPA